MQSNTIQSKYSIIRDNSIIVHYNIIHRSENTALAKKGPVLIMLVSANCVYFTFTCKYHISEGRGFKTLPSKI